MPKHLETVALEGISASRYITIAAKAMKNMGWNIISTTHTEVTAETPMSFMKNSWGEIISVYAINNTAEITSKSKGTILFDWGRNRKNTRLLAAEIAGLRPYWAAGEPAAEGNTEASAEEPQYVHVRPKEQESFLHFFIPKGDFFITPILIELNLAIFIIMVASGVSFFDPQVQDLIRWGGNFKPLVLGGEWWRLITCTFLHSGIFHVAFNMYALFFIGVYLEPLLGRTRYLTAYLVAGLLSSVASSWWHSGNFLSVGASGAIFGLYGVFLALLTTNIVDQHARKSLMTSVAVFVGYNLISGLTHKEVDNAAHIGGLLAGMITGYLFYFSFREPSDKKNRDVSVLLAAVALVITFSYVTTSKDDNIKFSQKYDAFIELQNDALAPLQNYAEGTPDSVLMKQLRDASLPDWEKAQLIIDSTGPLKLNPGYTRKRDLAREYARLRIRETELLINMLRTGDTVVNKNETVELRKKLQGLVSELDKL